VGIITVFCRIRCARRAEPRLRASRDAIRRLR
jgi:hypothetical protein